MEIYFNYDEEIGKHYFPLLTSPDISIRSTAIVDIILQKVYKEYPFEFTNLMHDVENSPNYYYSSGDKEYDALCRALQSYKSISGLCIREDLDKLEFIIHPTGKHGVNQVEYLTNEVTMGKMKRDQIESQIRELQVYNTDLKVRVQSLEQLTNALLFRIDNGMYEDKRHGAAQ